MSRMTDQQALKKARDRWGSRATISHFGPYFEVGDGRWTKGSARGSWEAAFADADWWESLRGVHVETRERKAARLIRESGKAVHTSDCSTSLAPGEEPGPCDCDAIQAEVRP